MTSPMEEDRDVLNRMRIEAFLTDFTLIAADGTRFPVHRALLASTSPFFRAFFQQNTEPQTEEVRLPLLSPNSITKCLEIAYLGTSSIGQQQCELEDLLKAATFLQMHRAIEICEQKLKSAISTHNLEGIYALADRYALFSTLSAVQNFLERRLVKIARKEANLRRISFRQFLDLVKSDRLAIDETELLEITKKWLDVTGERSNRNTVQAVLREIRLMLVEHDVLISLLPTTMELAMPFDVMPGDGGESHRRVYEALDYLTKPHLQTAIRGGQNRMRARRRISIRVAGKSLLPNGEETLQSELVEIDAREPGTVDIVTQLPDSAVSHHQAVVVNGFVFVMGGAKTICQRGLTAVNAVWRYDPRSKRWWQAAPMNERRAYFAAGSIGDRIYVAGGEFRFVASRTCEFYDPLTNTWTFMAPLPDEFSGNAGCAGPDGCFYTFGGWKGDDSTGDICDDVFRYFPDADRWEQLPPMRHDRAFHCCISAGRRIYVFGGVDHRKRPISFGEYLDLDTLTWHVTEPVPSMHNEGSCFAIFDQVDTEKVVGICVCGGYDAANKPQTTMALYDLDKGTWSLWQSGHFHRFIRFAGSCFVTVDVPIFDPDDLPSVSASGSFSRWLTVASTISNSNTNGNNGDNNASDGRGAASANRRARGRNRQGQGDNAEQAPPSVDHDYSF